MQLIFEKSRPGHKCEILPECEVPVYTPDKSLLRERPPKLPELSENEISRHYSALERRARGVNDGFYPLGSCTMKYNPKINEEICALPGFAQIHPLQPPETAQGCMEALVLAEEYLCEITGMDGMSFQPAAGAHGELAGIFMIKAYHHAAGDERRTKILIPDSAHGTNPASAAMAGYSVVNIPSGPDGGVDIDALRAQAGPDTAGLMLTNPNTVGLFDPNILEITEIIHDAGGLCYYDGANLNAIMGIVRPGDMGFDVVHLNLHKTFATPHGGGGPGSGPVGCKRELVPFLPRPYLGRCPYLGRDGETLRWTEPAQTIGKVRSFYGNFSVTLKALCYILSLGREGIPAAAETAVLNANYLMRRLEGSYKMAYPGRCMHEFVMSLEPLKKAYGVSALDIAKGLLDRGIHPPTMYFPLIVPEALMVEPTETESKQTLDDAAEVFLELYRLAEENPDLLHSAPEKTPVGRPDEVSAARNPRIRYSFE